MSNPFYDSSKKIHLRTGEEAYENHLTRVKNESKEGKQDNKAKKSQATIPLKIPSNVNDAGSYLILPGKVHGNYSYPDLLVSMEKFYHNNKWHKAHEELNKEDSFMLTIRQYVDFINLLKSGKVHNGKGNLVVDKGLLDKAIDEIITVRSPWRAEWLDAKFSKKTSGILNKSEQWYIAYHKINSNGNLEEVTEELEECLMQDKIPGISLDSWLDNANIQGLPSKNIPKGDLYYWNPRDGFVAWFYANSVGVDLGCEGDPDYSDAGRGVRRVKILK